ncbi:hypothetical protein [Poritiphilus flavus]|uniref:Uncharacterized protein n=1 Tax=Poritiphilus flavus TaxID=2697053 RepID=A0A6L9ED17_9FLAO|nr:hypothetical protein [Poritiphilus flavus]NAS12635.1 hypothetical protein [Poritiphilus flavus]
MDSKNKIPRNPLKRRSEALSSRNISARLRTTFWWGWDKSLSVDSK